MMKKIAFAMVAVSVSAAVLASSASAANVVLKPIQDTNNKPFTYLETVRPGIFAETEVYKESNGRITYRIYNMQAAFNPTNYIKVAWSRDYVDNSAAAPTQQVAQISAVAGTTVNQAMTTNYNPAVFVGDTLYGTAQANNGIWYAAGAYKVVSR
ncbi:hypothetical protein [Tumebacillus lipolyticus]|uniref:Uncharacterized protein n=1 Tax=Tumebacillus lipolyticus TaxID=1280370 RepID=A0ABW5A0Z8_9BACL